MSVTLLLLSLGLGIYVFSATLLIRRIRAPELRALAYSMPIPMTLVALGRNTDVSAGGLLGLILLGSFFFVVSCLEARGLRRVLAVLAALALYVMGSLVVSQVGLIVDSAAIVSLVAWLTPTVLILKQHSLRSIFLQKYPPSHRASRAVLAAVALISLGAVLLGPFLEEFLITFPFLGVAICLTYVGSLASFARSFWVLGLPPLAAFMTILIFTSDAGGVTLPWLASAIGAWALVVASLGLLRKRVISSHVKSQLRTIADAISEDPGARGIEALQSRDELQGELLHAAGAILRSRRIVLVTGFPIPVEDESIAETDGPVAAAILGAYLSLIEKEVRIVTDAGCADVVRGAANAAQSYCLRLGLTPPHSDVQVVSSLGVGEDIADTVYVFIERPGRAADGNLYTMRGVELRSVPDLGGVLQDRSCISVGIGDGGNEIGMGSVTDRVSTSIDQGKKIACVEATTYLIVAGTSNWGVYGLMGSLEASQRLMTSGTTLIRNLLPADQFVLDEVIKCGGIDGRTLEPAPTVDGLSTEIYSKPINVVSQAGRV